MQLPEPCAAGSEAAKAGYKTICEIAKERIRRAGAKIKAENALTAPGLDVGFRVLKVVDDRTLVNPLAYKTPADWAAADAAAFAADPLDPRTTADELLLHALRDARLPLDLRLARETVGGVAVRTASDGPQCVLMAVVADVRDELARLRPEQLAAFADGLDERVAKPKYLFVPQFLLPDASAAQQTFLARLQSAGILWKTL